MANSRVNQVFLGLCIALSATISLPQPGQANPPSTNRDCQTGLSEAHLTQLTQGEAPYPGAYYRFGEYYTCQNKPDQAIEAYQQAIALDPKFAHAHLALGQLYESQERWEQAIATYKMAIEIDSKLGKAYPLLARVYTQQNRPQDAQQTLDQALPSLLNQSFDARYSDSRYFEAQSYLQAGKQHLAQTALSQAEPLLKKAVSLNPSNTEAALALSDLLVQQNKLDAAINVVEQTYRYVLRRAEDNPAAIAIGTPYLSHSTLAQYFIARGNRDAAIAVLKKMHARLEEHDPSLQLHKASTEETINSYAFDALKASIPLQIGTLLMQQGQTEDALEQFRRAIQEATGPLTTSDFFQLIGDALKQQSDSKSSPDSLQTQDNVDAKAYKYLGDSYLQQRALPEAMKAYQDGLLLDPNHSNLHSSLGFTHLKSQQIPEAIAAYEKALALRSKNTNSEQDESVTRQAQATRFAAGELLRLKQKDLAINLLRLDLSKPMAKTERQQHQEVLARLYIVTKQYDLAEDLIQDIIIETSAEKQHNLYRELTQLQILQKKYTEAADTAQKLIQLFPDQGHGYTLLGQVYGHQNKPEQAVSSYLKSYQISKSSSLSQNPIEQEIQAHLQLGHQLKAQNNEQAALAIFSQLSDVAKQAGQKNSYQLARFNMATIYTNQKQYETAFDFLEDVLEYESQVDQSLRLKEPTHELLAKVFTHKGQYSKAIASYRIAQASTGVIDILFGNYSNISQDVLAFTSLGNELIAAEQYDIALEMLNLAIDLQPELAVSFQLRGMIYETQGNFTLAIQDYQQAIALVPDSFKNDSGLGLRFTNAVLSDSYLSWGRILLQQDKPQMAKKKLERAVWANDNNLEAHTLLKDAITQIDR